MTASLGRAWTSVDVVGHEFTHGVTQFTAGLIFGNTQSGGANESFSDIFGTMIEFYGGVNSDYLLAEDVNGAIRDMSNPRRFPQNLDHFSQFVGSPDPHFSSGIQNIAFYLLAEGGVHPTSGVNVKRIGRDGAAAVYFRALTVYLGPSARFIDVRAACENAARDIYGTGNPIYQAVRRSWFASGVGGDVPFNQIDDARTFVRQQYLDFLLREPDQGGWDYWTGQITQCGNDALCEDARRLAVSLAFFYTAEFQAQPRAANLRNPIPPPDFNNREFVHLCYLVHLQREPDQGGWDFWTSILNQNNDYFGVDRAFITSVEYTLRFGPA